MQWKLIWFQKNTTKQNKKQKNTQDYCNVVPGEETKSRNSEGELHHPFPFVGTGFFIGSVEIIGTVLSPPQHGSSLETSTILYCSNYSSFVTELDQHCNTNFSIFPQYSLMPGPWRGREGIGIAGDIESNHIWAQHWLSGLLQVHGSKF